MTLLEKFRQASKQNVNVPEGTSVLKEEIGTYAIPHTYREKYFFVIVSLTDEYGKVISHAEVLASYHQVNGG